MTKEDSYFHPMYWQKTKELEDLMPFQEEVLEYYKEYEAKKKKEASGMRVGKKI